MGPFYLEPLYLKTDILVPDEFEIPDQLIFIGILLGFSP